jgi:hypothetical protein
MNPACTVIRVLDPRNYSLPSIRAAADAWLGHPPRTVAGLAAGDRVRLQLAPGVWRTGRILRWERAPALPLSRMPATLMARVAVEREEETDPAEVGRTRVNLTPFPERPSSSPQGARATKDSSL